MNSFAYYLKHMFEDSYSKDEQDAHVREQSRILNTFTSLIEF